MAHGSPWVRDQIRAAVATYHAAVAVPDPLAHGARLGIEPASWCCRDATDPFMPHQGLQKVSPGQMLIFLWGMRFWICGWFGTLGAGGQRALDAQGRLTQLRVRQNVARSTPQEARKS